MELDLRQLLIIARRRWWIVVLMMLVAGAAAYWSASREQPQYSASTTLLVISGQPNSDSDLTALQTSRSLAETYRQLVETGPVLQIVIDELNLPYDIDGLSDKISTSVVEETQLVTITVTDHDPEGAARIANTTAEQFQQHITNQVDPRIGAQVQIPDPARVPSAPFAPQPRRSLLLGLFAGFMIGVAVVALLEYLDNTVKPEANFQTLTGAPLLATVSFLRHLAPGATQVFTVAQPRSGASEALRLLRTNLEFAGASSPIQSLTVTSPGSGEGKSTVVANLGVVMVQSGLTTAIIDADLRRPTLHRIFGTSNNAGLTTLLTHPDQHWEEVAERVALPGLSLIPSGPIPPNPADLLSSARFEAVIEQLMQDVDIVIVDSPPIRAASDPLAIAAHTDGVVLVSQSHQTRLDALRHAANAIHHGDIRLIGNVLNRQKGKQGDAYYGYYYYDSGTQEMPSVTKS